MIVTLGLYLGMAYLVHSVNDIWGSSLSAISSFYTLKLYLVYNFLDPHRENARVAAYIVGIPVAETVVFVVMWGLIHLRDWIFVRGRGVRVVEASAGTIVV